MMFSPFSWKALLIYLLSCALVFANVKAAGSSTTTTTTTTTAASTVRANNQHKQQQQQQQAAKCQQPLETGPCRMSLDRFYYNAKTNTCEPFKYGGCRGNDNRFGFRQTCEEACITKKTAAAKS